MKVFFHSDFYSEYTSDPAAEAGRMEAILRIIETEVTMMDIELAGEEDIAAVHSPDHIRRIKESGLYGIAALAAGGAIQAALTGLSEPAFGLIRPPGHHASAGSAWGFCFFNNMAIAIDKLKREGRIETAYVLDIDMHHGDGTENILGQSSWVTIHNVATRNRQAYIAEVQRAMDSCGADIIGISAGFDNHQKDWGGVLTTEDYTTIGRLVRKAADRKGGGCFGILEGGYNHDVLGQNVLALIQGLSNQTESVI
ncbi:MAG: histone deacetylase family protein [Thermodesulfobacteriota bacterium]